MRAAVCHPGARVAYAVGASPLGCHAADFDEDGVLDLAVPAFGGHLVSVLLGAGDGTFAAAADYALANGSYPAALVSADLDSDGILDLAVADQGRASVSLLFGQGGNGDGDGTFTVGAEIAVSGTPWGIAAGDFDADGVTDLATAGGSGYLSVLIGNGLDAAGDGTFAAAVNYPLGSAAYGLTTGDFDEDGITDVAVAASAGLIVLPGLGTDGRGDGTFGARTVYACQTFPYGVATGDFDADGATDLAVANAGSHTVSILLGNGDGTFAAAVSYAAGSTPYDVAVGDWNGDGAADLAAPNSTTAGAVSILPGQRPGGLPDGTFGAPQVLAAGAEARGLTAGDLDGDGTADLAVANLTSVGTVSVLLATCPSPLPATLEVTAPAGGERWITGTQQTLSWRRGAGILAVDVALSRDGGGEWQTLARGVTDTCWTWNVVGPLTTQARVRVQDPAVPSHAATSDSVFTIIPASLADTAAPVLAGLALLSVGPNPARAAVRVSFALPDAGAAAPVRIELLDLSGRRVRSLELRGLEPGLHEAELDGIGALPPGLFVVRLSHQGWHVARKLVVTR